MMIRRYVLLLILLLFLTGSLIAPVLSANQTSDPSGPTTYPNTGPGIMKAGGSTAVSELAGLLSFIGLDTSYGDSGETIFSMVEASLNTIITDLSSGKTEGFLQVPLIKETFTHLGMEPEEVVIDPENVSNSFQPIDLYNRRYNGP